MRYGAVHGVVLGLALRLERGGHQGVTFVGEGGWGGYFLRTELLNDAGLV